MNMNIINTKKFRTITVKVEFRNKFNKDNITLRNMFVTYMTYITNSYKSHRDLVLKLEELYASSITGKCYRSGNLNIIDFDLTLLNPKYTEKKVFTEGVKLLKNVIYNPNFNEEIYNKYINYLKDNMKNEINSVKENPDSYVTYKLFSSLDDYNYKYSDIGNISDLEKINLNTLKDYYKEVINNSLINIYIVGNVNNDMIDLINKEFNINNNILLDNYIIKPRINKNINIIKEKYNTIQSNINIALKFNDLNEFERNYVINIYNLILGGGTNSKFFSIIREKNSLAYYCYSYMHKLDNLMIIKSGIASNNYDKVLSLIKNIIESIKNNEFTDEEIKIAKNSYISMLKEIEDDPDLLIEAKRSESLLNLGNLKERYENILKVKREDILKVSKKIYIDTIYFLEGSYEEN